MTAPVPETDLLRQAGLRLVTASGALLLLVLLGTAGYVWMEDYPPFEAFYMTIITLSTVGFGEIRPLSTVGRLFTVGLIIAGAGLLAYVFSTSAELFFSSEWRRYWAKRQQRKMLKQLQQHVIVCGYGRVGRSVAHSLHTARLPFVVLDPNAEKIQHLQRDGYLALQANGANEHHLQEAGIQQARALIAAANSDAENVFITLTARSLRADLFIVARANYEESESKLQRAGANRVILPYHIAGRRMVTMLLHSEMADFLDEVGHVGLELVLEQIKVHPTSPLAGQTLGQADLRRRLGVVVMACHPPGGKLEMRPTAATVLAAEAQLIVLGTPEQLHTLRDWASQAGHDR